MRRLRRTVAALMFALIWMMTPAVLRAQDDQPKSDLTGWAQAADPELKGMVMVSFIRDGGILMQTEIRLGSLTSLNAFTGIYDIRYEGEGMITVIKRGLVVTKGQNNNVTAVMRRGQGVKVIQYEPTAATLEELAGRLAKLEAAFEEFKKKYV